MMNLDEIVLDALRGREVWLKDLTSNELAKLSQWAESLDTATYRLMKAAEAIGAACDCERIDRRIPPSSVSHDTLQKGLWIGNFFTGKTATVLPVWVGVQELPISLKGLTPEEFQEVYAVALTLHEAVINEDYDRNERS